ncbi:hypothetical protein A8M56_18355 [Yersinia pestis]|nr:hypothetical protein A8M56_18355 [Yersinia pestis]
MLPCCFAGRCRVVLAGLATPRTVGLIPGTPQRDRWLTGLVVGTGILTLCALLSYAGTRLSGRKHFDELRQQAQGDDAPLPEDNAQAGETQQGEPSRLKPACAAVTVCSGATKSGC